MKHSKTKKRKFRKPGKKTIIVISIILVLCLVSGGGFVFWKMNQREPTTRDSHIQVATETVEKDEKILIRTEAGQDPVYIDAIEGMPKNSYDDNSFYIDDYGYKAYDDDGKKISSVGIDVSYVQGDIDWKAVKNSGVDFAMLRCGGRGYGSNGVLYEDETFEKNAQDALDAGIDIGVYFFSQAITVEEALEEAEYTLELIKDYDIKYPVAFDWEHYEFDDARTDNLDRETLTNIARTYCTEIEKAGYIPVIYANRSLLYYEYDLAKLADLELWLASYEELPDFYYDFGMWQYSTEGTINGIEGTVDLNICMYKY